MKPLSLLLFLAMSLWQCQSADQSASAPSTPDETVAEQPGQPTTTALAENTDGPRITFDKVRHHFGSIWHAEKVTYAYTFKNSGTEALVIKEVKTSCGCTVPTYPKEAILPGETASIEIKYATNRVGAFNKTITVMSNADVPQKKLRIKGNVLAKNTVSKL